MQPQAVELEEAILGALMIEKEAWGRIEGILSADDFYNDKNKTIFQAMIRLNNKREPIDMLTVVEELKRMDKIQEINPLAIYEITNRIASSAHIEYHARIVSQKSLARKIISMSSKAVEMAFDESIDVAETMEEIEKDFSNLNASAEGFESIDINQAIKLAVSNAEKAQAEREQGKITSIPTHLNGLNRAFDGGWRAPDLIILGGRPSMGKTQHSLAIAMAAANAGQDCLFISIEMTAIQLVNRLILESDSISSYNLRTGQMNSHEWQALDQRVSQIMNTSLHIADNHNIRYLNNIKTEARRLHRQGRLKMMIIDYLQLIKTNMKFERRQLEVAHITGELKSLAKELGIPIMALSQLSRPPKGSAVKEPDLEDLREAGDIEQDADIVIFIHKPHYYDTTLTDWENKGMLIIRKSREGVRNEGVQFAHDERYKKIYDDSTYISSTANTAPF